MQKLTLAICLCFSANLVAQTTPPPPPTPPTKELTPKSTDAQKTLLKLTKELEKPSKELNDKLQQARTMLDKKNKPLIDNMTALQKQIVKNSEDAQVEFGKQNAEIQNKAQLILAQISGIIAVVRSENGFPDNATFNVQTKKWTVPDETPAKK